MRDASYHQLRGAFPGGRLAEASPRLFWSAATPLADALSAGVAPKAEAVEVYANEGRWIVECPDCHSAQLAARDDQRFMCNECANIAVGGLWRPAIWPRQVDAIEEILEQRERANQHWIPGETVTQLRLENAAHGIEG